MLIRFVVSGSPVAPIAAYRFFPLRGSTATVMRERVATRKLGRVMTPIAVHVLPESLLRYRTLPLLESIATR